MATGTKPIQQKATGRAGRSVTGGHAERRRAEQKVRRYEREEPMKRLVVLCGVATLVLFASSARAAPIDYNIVKVEDFLVGGFDNVGNSEAAEQDFLFDYLVGQGFDAADLTYEKIDLNGQSSYSEVINDPAGTNLWAIDFASFGLTDPLAFLVRFGNAEHDHYLYKNLANTQYGVVDLADISARRGNITITSISHTSVAEGPTTTVPEPASASLMLLGLGVVGAASRKRRRELA
jgi:hypothetical protein